MVLFFILEVVVILVLVIILLVVTVISVLPFSIIIVSVDIVIIVSIVAPISIGVRCVSDFIKFVFRSPVALYCTYCTYARTVLTYRIDLSYTYCTYIPYSFSPSRILNPDTV